MPRHSMLLAVFLVGGVPACATTSANTQATASTKATSSRADATLPTASGRGSAASRHADFNDSRSLDPRITADRQDLERTVGVSDAPYTGTPDYLTPAPPRRRMESEPLVTGEAAPADAPVAVKATAVEKRLTRFDDLVTRVETHPPVTTHDIVALKRAAADVGGELPEKPALYQAAEEMETTISALHASSDPRELLKHLLALSSRIRGSL